MTTTTGAARPTLNGTLRSGPTDRTPTQQRLTAMPQDTTADVHAVVAAADDAELNAPTALEREQAWWVGAYARQYLAWHANAMTPQRPPWQADF